MKHYLKPIFTLIALALLTTTSVQAASEEKMIIALKTDSFELTETDISTLAIGEAKTIETDSGKVIDIIRTADGAEIYVDGELLEINFDREGLHEQHMIKKHVEVICDSDEECDKTVVIMMSDDNDLSEWVNDDGEAVFIHKEIELSCTDDNEEGTHCSDTMIWISDGGDIDLEELHEMHGSEGDHKIILIRKDVVIED